MDYIFLCREAYFAGVTPSGKDSKGNALYKKIVDAGNAEIRKSGIEGFMGYLQYGEYLIQLWTVHIVMEYNLPLKPVRDRCLAEIEKYASSTLNSKVADEESEWLTLNSDLFMP